jgi:hypothetical protein
MVSQSVVLVLHVPDADEAIEITVHTHRNTHIATHCARKNGPMIRSSNLFGGGFRIFRMKPATRSRP